MKKENLLDQQFRLECLKLAASLHPHVNGFGEIEQSNIPQKVQLDADKYFAYIKNYKIAD